MHRIESYIRLALIFIVIFTISSLPVMLYLKKQGKNMIRQLSYLGLFCSIFLIIFATILYTPISLHPQTHTINLIPNLWIQTSNSDQLVVEKIPNVLLFIPFGFFIPIVFQKMRSFFKTTSISFALTFSIEFIQYFIGRSSDIDDIITNLLGAIIGYLIFQLFHKIFQYKKRWKMLNHNYKNINEIT